MSGAQVVPETPSLVTVVVAEGQESEVDDIAGGK